MSYRDIEELKDERGFIVDHSAHIKIQQCEYLDNIIEQDHRVRLCFSDLPPSDSLVALENLV